MKITYLKVLRLKKGLKQEDLARELNISRSYISHFENKRYEPSEKMAKKLEDYFNEPIDHLLSYIDI